VYSSLHDAGRVGHCKYAVVISDSNYTHGDERDMAGEKEIIPATDIFRATEICKEHKDENWDIYDLSGGPIFIASNRYRNKLA
jgi:hypothetical protein